MAAADRPADPYADLARYYELDPGGFDDDLDFWRNLARHAGGPVLEVGCGTGRLLLPLARDGLEVVGIDPSPAMLARARARLAAEPALREWATLVQADVRDLRLEGGARYQLAIAALGVFGHLLDHDDALRALERLRAHVADDGLLALDLPNPLTLLDELPDGLLFHDWTRLEPETGRSVLRFHSRRVDPVAQIVETAFLYDELGTDGAVRRTVAPISLRYYHAAELERLLAASRFRLERLYGDWELAEYAADSPRLIAVARAGR
jgi:SAM-dependent methyltransferase